MFENSPARSWIWASAGAGSSGSRPVNASKSVCARFSGNVHDIDPASDPSSNRTVATSQRGTRSASASNERSSRGSATAKKLCSATRRTATKTAAADSGSISFGTPAVGDFIEDISEHLRTERFFEIAGDVEVGRLLAARRRAVGGNDHAAQAAPAVVQGNLAQHLGAAHHRHVDVGEQQLDVIRLEQRQTLGAVAGLEDGLDVHVGELDDPLDHGPH